MSVLSGKKGGMKQYRVRVWRRAPAPSLGMLVPTKDSLSILPKSRLLTWRNVCRSLPHLEQADIRLGLKNKDIAKFLQCGQWNLSFPRLFLQDPEKKIFQPKDKKMFCIVLINFLVLISGCRTSDLLWFDPHHMYFLQVYSLIAKLKSDHSVPQVKSYVFCSHSLLRVVSAESFHLNGIKRHFFLSFLWKPSKCLFFFFSVFLWKIRTGLSAENYSLTSSLSAFPAKSVHWVLWSLYFSVGNGLKFPSSALWISSLIQGTEMRPVQTTQSYTIENVLLYP